MTAPKLTIQGTNVDTQPYGEVARVAWKEVLYQGSFGATEAAETTVDIIQVNPYRSIVFSTQATAWGTATVALKIYPCDAAGNANANPFFTRSLTANDASPVLLFLAEMGGTTSTATWPASAAATGAVIGPFGNYIKITEQCTAFTSGTNTVTVKVEAKG
jgi:hypothetical protein